MKPLNFLTSACWEWRATLHCYSQVVAIILEAIRCANGEGENHELD